MLEIDDMGESEEVEFRAHRIICIITQTKTPGTVIECDRPWQACAVSTGHECSLSNAIAGQ